MGRRKRRGRVVVGWSLLLPGGVGRVRLSQRDGAAAGCALVSIQTPAPDCSYLLCS
jgi:hypothetical protein